MITQFVVLMLLTPTQGNAQLAVIYAQDNPPLSRYFASLAAMDLMPDVAPLGEGRSVAWAFFPGAPTKPILFERAPGWSRLVRFDVAERKVGWKAQLYACTAAKRGTLDEMLREAGMGVVYKSGDLSTFRTDCSNAAELVVYQHQAPVGILIRTVYRLGEQEHAKTFDVRSDHELRKLGFP